MAIDCRTAAAKVLARVLAGQSLAQALPPMLERVPPRDRALLQQLCYGTLRNFHHLQGLLQQLLSKPIKDKDRDVQALLLVGLYQLSDTRIPDHAAVAATVDATKGLKKNWARGLSNAILRRYLREKETLEAALTETQRDSHPKWLHKAVHQQWPEQATQILAANNAQPPMVLRVNAQRGDRTEYLARLAEQDISARVGELSPHAIYLDEPRDVATLPGFGEGHVSVQDEAAQLAAALLSAQPGEHILDACAAPGGKTCHILELEPAVARLYAADIEPERLQRVTENLQRLELDAQLLTMDCSEPDTSLSQLEFDRILVDAPCSASGVIRRHPDIKLLRRSEDIPALAQQQLAILAGLWPLLKPGGTLLYVTCSILAAENDGVVATFVSTNKDATLQPIDKAWGIATASGRQLLPEQEGSDGLFFARLQKAHG
ncbi:MAG: 16S rRNA (cytosine(967)-C(5))-methyltransferase RsmB [Halieaceae bacterium]